MHPDALLSVLMPVYNGACYLAEAIESILQQTYAHFELIIVDDGSTDASAAIIRRYAAQDARIRPLYNEHHGPAGANAGVAIARGAFIARMDADDIALPERFAAQLAWLEHTGVDMCGSQIEAFGAHSAIWWYPETHPAIAYELLFRCGLLHPTVLMRAEILRDQPYSAQAAYDDYELWTRLAPHYTMGNVPSVLLKHRCHPQQTHVVQAARFVGDFQRYRLRYFYTLFPQTPWDDYLALARISDRLPMTSLEELARAGQWLVTLASPPDRRLRERMGQRWHETCRRSVALGPAVEAVYHRYRMQLDDLVDQPE